VNKDARKLDMLVFQIYFVLNISVSKRLNIAKSVSMYYSLICSTILITMIINEYSLSFSDFDQRSTFTDQCIIEIRCILLIDIVISIALKSVKFH